MTTERWTFIGILAVIVTVLIVSLGWSAWSAGILFLWRTLSPYAWYIAVALFGAAIGASELAGCSAASRRGRDTLGQVAPAPPCGDGRPLRASVTRAQTVHSNWAFRRRIASPPPR